LRCPKKNNNIGSTFTKQASAPKFTTAGITDHSFTCGTHVTKQKLQMQLLSASSATHVLNNLDEK
jgi:hypothetical protein